eukprot:8608660-Prorocentrum_lima.AAC.1
MHLTPSLFLPAIVPISEPIYCSSDFPHCPCFNSSKSCQAVWHNYQNDCALADWGIEEGVRYVSS